LVVELFPELAPETTARVRELEREGYFDGAPFDLVVDGFFASVKLRAPAGRSSVAALADDLLKPAKAAGAPVVVADPDRGGLGAYADGGVEFGIYKGLAVAAPSEDAASSWIALCPGVVATGVADSAGEPRLHIMLAEAPALDGAAVPFGRVIDGIDRLYELAAGNAAAPQFEPDAMTRVRLASELSPAAARGLQREVAGVLDETGPGFAEFLASLRAQLGREPRLCEIRLPVVAGVSAVAVSAARPEGP
jgi:cyclophilin family peptidyl-prolyl cis-trans isomerase